MGETRYAVVTRGIIEGEKVEEVRARLRKMIKNKQINLDLIIDKAELVVKKDLDLETAKKYRDGFHRAGVICELRRQDEKLEAMVCPQCGFRQPKADACIRCGIVIERYREIEQETVGEQEAQNPGEYSTAASVSPVDRFVDTVKKIWSFKGGPITIVVVGLFIAYSVFETIWLGGNLVSYKRVTVTGPNNFVEFRVQRPAQRCLIQIHTRKKMKLNIRLVDSNGKVYYEDTEYAGHKSRNITFTPQIPGLYRVYVSLGPLNFSTFMRASVSVYVNDHRILPRIFGRIRI